MITELGDLCFLLLRYPACVPKLRLQALKPASGVLNFALILAVFLGGDMPVRKLRVKLFFLLFEVCEGLFGFLYISLDFLVVLRADLARLELLFGFFLLVFQGFQACGSLVDSLFQGGVPLFPLGICFKCSFCFFLIFFKDFELVGGGFYRIGKQFVLLTYQLGVRGVELQALLYFVKLPLCSRKCLVRRGKGFCQSARIAADLDGNAFYFSSHLPTPSRLF